MLNNQMMKQPQQDPKTQQQAAINLGYSLMEPILQRIQKEYERYEVPQMQAKLKSNYGDYVRLKRGGLVVHSVIDEE
jgi:ribosomal protein S17